MSVIRLSVFLVSLAFFALSGFPLLAQAAPGDRVITTDRLNLRTCPGTSGCRVLRTLPLDTSLQVIDRRDEWLQVTVLEDGASGWVYSSYARVVEPPSSFAFSSPLSREFLKGLLVAACLLGVLLVMSYVGPKLNSGITGIQFFKLSILSITLGIIVILNQFGVILANLARPFLQLDKLGFLWEINAVVESRINYSHVVLFLAAVVVGVAAVAPTVNGCKVSFLQGVCTGFSALPVMVVILLLAVAAGYIVSLVFKFIWFLFGVIAIPFVWVWKNALLPLLRFLATPLIWLWENFLRDLVELLAVPFVWVWKVILLPVLGFVFKFVLGPIFVFLLGTAAALLALLPFGIIGAVILESLRSAMRGSLNTLGLFSQGVAIGFLLFDAALLASLNAFDLLHTVPPLSLIIPVALQVIVFLRLLGPSTDMYEEACPIFQDKLRSYWRSSRLELLSTCVIVPIGLLATIYAEDD